MLGRILLFLLTNDTARDVCITLLRAAAARTTNEIDNAVVDVIDYAWRLEITKSGKVRIFD